MEDVLKFKIFGVDMIAVSCILLLSAIIFAFHDGRKGSVLSRWKLPVGCIAFGVFSLMWAHGMYERYSAAREVSDTWTRVEGVVFRVEEFEHRSSGRKGRGGRVSYSNRATVRFLHSDGTIKTGLLFHEKHEPGSRIIVYFDPTKNYSFGAPIYNGARQLKSPDSIERDLKSTVVIAGLGFGIAGSCLCGFGVWNIARLTLGDTRKARL